jgi:hypothetical protein
LLLEREFREILIALYALVEKGIICYEYDQRGKKFYKLVDLLMLRWFQNYAY